MSDVVKEKAIAAATMTLGVVRMGSGVATALGLGIVGGMLRHHHLMQAAQRIGQLSIEGGKRQFDEGRDDWDRAAS